MDIDYDELNSYINTLQICNHVISATEINKDFKTSFNLLRELYPDLDNLDKAYVSMEGFFKVAGNIIIRIHEIVDEIIKKIIRFIRGFFNSRVKRSVTLRENITVIKNIRDNMLITDGSKMVADFDILTNSIVDFKLFKERFKVFDKIVTNLNRLPKDEIIVNIPGKDVKGYVKDIFDINVSDTKEYGIIADPNTHSIRYLNVTLSDYHKRMRIYDLNRALTLIREYETSLTLYESYLKLLERIEATALKFQRINDEIYKHRDLPHLSEGETVNRNVYVGGIRIVEELIRVTQATLNIVTNDLDKMEIITGVMARFLARHRRSVTD